MITGQPSVTLVDDILAGQMFMSENVHNNQKPIQPKKKVNGKQAHKCHSSHQSVAQQIKPYQNGNNKPTAAKI